MSQALKLPRRARQISQMANAIAADRLRVLSLRQAVSDRIGYAVAVTLGALAKWASWWAVGLLVVGYVIAAVCDTPPEAMAMGRADKRADEEDDRADDLLVGG